MRRPWPEGPAPLRQGGRVVLVAPASAVAPRRIEAAVRALEAQGFEVVVDAGCRRRWRWFAGPDEARARALVEAMRNPRFDAVWALRGGEGCTRLLPLLDSARDALLARPVPFVGLSDVTALHAWFNAAGRVTWHAPVAVQWPSTAAHWRRAVVAALARPAAWTLGLDGRCRVLRPGRVRGRLVGGNLTVLAALAGTPWCPSLRGAVVLVEDIGEPAYRVDRALVQLDQCAGLREAAALLVGDFSEVAPGERRRLRRLWRDLAAGARGPVVTGVPAGHGSRNAAWPLGARVEVDTEARRVWRVP